MTGTTEAIPIRFQGGKSGGVNIGAILARDILTSNTTTLFFQQELSRALESSKNKVDPHRTPIEARKNTVAAYTQEVLLRDVGENRSKESDRPIKAHKTRWDKEKAPTKIDEKEPIKEDRRTKNIPGRWEYIVIDLLKQTGIRTEDGGKILSESMSNGSLDLGKLREELQTYFHQNPDLGGECLQKTLNNKSKSSNDLITQLVFLLDTDPDDLNLSPDLKALADQVMRNTMDSSGKVARETQFLWNSPLGDYSAVNEFISLLQANGLDASLLSDMFFASVNSGNEGASETLLNALGGYGGKNGAEALSAFFSLGDYTLSPGIMGSVGTFPGIFAEEAPLVMSSSFVDQLATQMSNMIGTGRGQITLGIHPPHLGNLRIMVKLHQGELQSLIQASNEEIKQLLDSKSGELRHILEQHGLNLAEFRVTLLPQVSSADKAWNFHWEQDTNKNRDKEERGKPSYGRNNGQSESFKQTLDVVT